MPLPSNLSRISSWWGEWLLTILSSPHVLIISFESFLLLPYLLFPGKCGVIVRVLCLSPLLRVIDSFLWGCIRMISSHFQRWSPLASHKNKTGEAGSVLFVCNLWLAPLSSVGKSICCSYPRGLRYLQYKMKGLRKWDMLCASLRTASITPYTSESLSFSHPGLFALLSISPVSIQWEWDFKLCRVIWLSEGSC